MSAKQHYDGHAQFKSFNTLPDLPPEIWFDIFRIAAFAPEILSPDILTLDFYKTPTAERRRIAKQSLITKRYIVRVCKKWNAIGTQLLYENIVVGKGRTLPSLCTTLLFSRHAAYTSTPNPNRSVGWWTRRFDIALRDLNSIELLGDIVACLPNLTIITFSVTAPQSKSVLLPKSMLQAVAKSNRNLKVITWYSDGLKPSVHDWRAFLATSPNLYAIHTEDKMPLPTNNSSPLTLPTLTTLSISQHFDSSPRNVPHVHFPSLRHLIFRMSIARRLDENWISMVKTHGAGITSAQIQYDFSEYHTVAHLVQADLHLLSTYCPSLRTLELALGQWYHLGSNPILPSSVTRLGLRSTRLQAPQHRYDWLFDILGNVARHQTNVTRHQTLEVVQLIDQGDVADLRERHRKTFSNGVKMLKVMKLRLEDHEGNLLE